MLRPRTPPALVALAVAAVLAGLGACGNHGDGLIEGKVDIGLTTTTGATSCDAVVLAERAISEATFGAIDAGADADADAKAVVRQRFAELRASLPSELAPEVDDLEAAFQRAWAIDSTGENGANGENGDEHDDPFETTAYVTADQAIRQYADSCSGPRSTGDPSRVPTTSELPPEAMTIPLPPGEPPADATG